MTTDTPFRPFEDRLDQESALALLRDAVAGADDGELFLERRRSEMLSWDDGRVRNASYDASEGFGLRAVRGETAGYAHSTEMTEHALRRAVETARLAVGAASPVARRLPALEAKLVGQQVDQLDLAGFVTAEDLAPLAPIDDVRGSASYRLQVVPELLARALEAACAP